MKQQIDALNQWYTSLQPREKIMVVATSIVMTITLFYLIVWEPIYNGLEQQQQQYESQQSAFIWMQTAAAEAKALKKSGARPISSTSQPVSLLVEQSAASAGLKKHMGKLESSGKQGARIKLDDASFNQILIWLNTLQEKHGITVTSANIDLADKPGTVNARLSLNRS